VQAAGRHLEVGGQDDLDRAGSIMAVALDSTTSWMVFMPAHTPA
jgi:hypothetical protein